MLEFDDLPAPRPLPPAVRAAARHRIGEGLSERSATGHPGRSAVAALGAVAAVLTVVGLGTAMLTSVRSGPAALPSGSAAAAGDEDPATPLAAFAPADLYRMRDAATADVARCVAAPAAAGAAAGWEPMFTASARGVTVVTFRAGGGIRFCELTPETVSVSAEAPATGAAASITYVSRLGTVAGVVAADVTSVDVADPLLPQKITDQGQPALVRDGAFVLPNATTAAPTGLTLHLGGSPGRTAERIPVSAPELPVPVTPQVDRPQAAPDGEPAAAEFSPCTRDGSAVPLVDAHRWVRTATVRLSATQTVHLARYQGMLASCVVTGVTGSAGGAALTVDDGLPIAGMRLFEAEPNSFLFTHSVFYDFSGNRSDTIAVTGLVTDDRVARVSVGRPGREPAAASVVDGTFVVPGVRLDDGAGPTTVTATDAAGRTLVTVPLDGTRPMLSDRSGG